MSVEYDHYIADHKENVKRALEWLIENLPDKLIDDEAMKTDI